ncbi:MAG: hypothetical protein KC474_08705 [Cyanobacteria bacterium HKST-UBA04]|nr:hypothetical protein [Cyanobacteria bacterium HKST-UBA04]
MRLWTVSGGQMPQGRLTGLRAIRPNRFGQVYITAPARDYNEDQIRTVTGDQWIGTGGHQTLVVETSQVPYGLRPKGQENADRFQLFLTDSGSHPSAQQYLDQPVDDQDQTLMDLEGEGELYTTALSEFLERASDCDAVTVLSADTALFDEVARRSKTRLVKPHAKPHDNPAASSPVPARWGGHQGLWERLKVPMLRLVVPSGHQLGARLKGTHEAFDGAYSQWLSQIMFRRDAPPSLN